MSEPTKTDDAKTESKKPEPMVEEEPVVTRHTIKVGGKDFAYSVTTGRMPLRNDDGEIGKHADVVVRGTRAFIFYFTHPDGQRNGVKEGVMPFSDRRSSIQVAELEVRDGRLCCDRDSPCTVDLASSR